MNKGKGKGKGKKGQNTGAFLDKTAVDNVFSVVEQRVDAGPSYANHRKRAELQERLRMKSCASRLEDIERRDAAKAAAHAAVADAETNEDEVCRGDPP